MKRLRAWALRVAGLFGRTRRDRDLADEIQSHLDMHVDDNLRAGMTPDEARRAAMLQFGGIEAVKERYRDQRGIPAVDALVQDMRFGARVLRRYPAFTAVAVATVALAVGPNTAIFSLVDAVLLRPLPYPDPGRLVVINETDKERGVSVSYLNFEDWVRQQTVFERLALFQSEPVTLTGRGEAERLTGAVVTSGLFPLLGFAPTVGSALSDADDVAGSPRKVVLSQGLWRRRFGGDPAIVGQTLVLNGQPHLVAGVMSDRPSVPRDAELWVSLGPRLTTEAYRLRANHMGYTALGRLRPGVTLERARVAMSTIAARLAAQYPDSNTNSGIVLTPMLEKMVGVYRRALVFLEAAVGLVLLVACANLANLLFVRGASRRQELAMRVALGAGRRRIVRQLLTESAMLALAGGAVGVLMARWSRGAILALAPQGAARFDQVQIDWRVGAFAAAVSVLVGLVAGSWPALRLAGAKAVNAIELAERGSVGAPQKRRIRQALVAGEIAVTLVLLVTAVLLARSLSRLQSVPLGFEPKGVLLLAVDLSPVRYPKPDSINAFYGGLLARVRAVPGVRGVTLDSAAPLDTNWQTQFEVEGRPPFPLNERPSIEVSVVDAAYFSVMRIPVLAGRSFNAGDAATGQHTIIIDETFARRIWPGADAVGKRLRFWQGTPYDMTCTVVGIVPTVRLYGYGVEPQLIQAYFPEAQIGVREMTVIVRADGDPAAVAPTLRQIVRQMDAAAPVHSVRTLHQDLSDSVSSSRLLVWLAIVFAALAVLLAAVGVYGVVAYGVTEQTREIAVRLAVGAKPSRVLWMVVQQGARAALLGVAVGLGCALAGGRMLRGLLFGISPTDPATLGGVAGGLLLLALVACYVPGLRATRVDPAATLR